MIKNTSLIILCSIFLSFSKGSLLNVAVLELNGNGVSDANLKVLSNKLRTEMFNTKKYNILERSRMNSILKEQGFQQSGCLNDSCIVEIGQLLSVSHIAIGECSYIGDYSTLTIRLVNVRTGEISAIAHKVTRGDIQEIHDRLIPECVLDLINPTNNKKNDGLSNIINKIKNSTYEVINNRPITIEQAIKNQISEMKGQVDIIGWNLISTENKKYCATFSIKHNDVLKIVVIEMFANTSKIRDIGRDTLALKEYGLEPHLLKTFHTRSISGLNKTIEQEIDEILGITNEK